MRVEYVPLLQVQRDLYAIPRGMERFREYLKTMIDTDGDIRLPLSPMNPMGKDHIPALLDAYLALGADAAAAAALEGFGSGEQFRLALVVSDDAQGGWTNRYFSEFSQRFESKAMLKRGWIVGLLWTSEPPSVERVREETRVAAYRAAWIHEHGPAQTLREMLAQEGFAMASAGCTEPWLDPDDVEYTRAVLERHLDATDKPTLMTALFGDRAAMSLGYAPMGLSHRAGLALALHDAARVRV